MSIKDLFNKGYSIKTLKSQNRNSSRENLESERYVEAYSTKRQRYFPSVDFATASNFARFGLAEEYYDASIKRIYETYPYDGSAAEKIEWENESTYLDLFIFENEYPRTNGFVSFNSSSHSTIGAISNTVYSSSVPQYIKLFGGPHADPNGDYKSEFSAGPSKKGISKANIYNNSSGRNTTIEIVFTSGNTVEFWMKKDGWVSTSAARKEFIFHNMATGSSGSEYASLEISALGTSPANITINIVSGSTDTTSTFSTGLSTIADENWHHYAFTAKTAAANTVLDFYLDGQHIDTVITGRSFGSIIGKM